MNTREEAIQARLDAIPGTMRSVYAKAMTGASRAAAIKAKCYDCSGWQRKEAHECPAVACPLHPYRPTSDAAGNAPEISVEANGEALRETEGQIHPAGGVPDIDPVEASGEGVREKELNTGGPPRGRFVARQP